MSTLRSEVVLQTKLTTDTQVVHELIFSSDEGELTVDAESVRNGDANTCFTREASAVLCTVSSDDSRATLDIVRSAGLTDGTFVANVEISSSSV